MRVLATLVLLFSCSLRADDLWLHVVPNPVGAATIGPAPARPAKGKAAPKPPATIAAAVPVFRTGDGGTVDLTSGPAFPTAGAAVPKPRIDRTWVRIGTSPALPLTGAREEPPVTRLEATYAGLGLASVGILLAPSASTLDAPSFEALLTRAGATAAIEERVKKKETKKSVKLVSVDGAAAYALVTSGKSDPAVTVIEPLGMPFELLAVESPVSPRAGGSLPVRALHDGRPAPQVALTLRPPAGEPSRLVTDDEGRTALAFPAPGPYLVTGTVVRRLLKADRKKGEAYKSADWEALTASLRLDVLPAAPAPTPVPSPSRRRKKS